MSEITVVTNLQITKIYKDTKEDFAFDKTAFAAGQKDIAKNALDADDVIVLSVQEFVIDEESQSEV